MDAIYANPFDASLHDKREVPSCPECENKNISTIGATSCDRYKYRCSNQTCRNEWIQTRPYIMKTNNAPANIIKVGTRSVKGGVYKCKQCGQSKLDHVCPRKTPSPKLATSHGKKRCRKCGMLKKGHVCTGQIGVDNMAEYIRSDTSNAIIDILSEDSFLSTASTSSCIDFEQSIRSLSTHPDECDDEVGNLGLDRCQAGC